MITKPRVLWPSLIAIVAVMLSSFRAIAAEEIHTVIVVGAGISGGAITSLLYSMHFCHSITHQLIFF